MIWWFPEIGVPQIYHPFSCRIFHEINNNQLLGYPHKTTETILWIITHDIIDIPSWTFMGIPILISLIFPDSHGENHGENPIWSQWFHSIVAASNSGTEASTAVVVAAPTNSVGTCRHGLLPNGYRYPQHHPAHVIHRIVLWIFHGNKSNCTDSRLVWIPNRIFSLIGLLEMPSSTIIW